MGDAAVRFLSVDVHIRHVARMITRNAGEVVDTR
jgi:hypothetical protein